MTKISAKVQSRIDKAFFNDGKIDAKEALAIASKTKKKEGAAVAQALMDDGFTGSTAEMDAVAKKLGLKSMPQSELEYSVQDAKQDLAIEHVSIDGVKFDIAEDVKHKVSPQQLKEIAAAVNANNKLISDPKLQVHCVAIAPSVLGTHMATFKGKPMIVMDTKDAVAATGSHESGHQVLFALKKSGKANDVLLQVGDIYERLKATKQVNGTTKLYGKSVTQKGASGLWPFDPPTWSKDKKATSEHPFDNADEFFASAVAAWRTDRAGLEKAIARYAKKDPAGAAPAKEMLALLDNLAAGGQLTSPALSKAAKAAAQADVDKITDPTPEDSSYEANLGLSLTLNYGVVKP